MNCLCAMNQNEWLRPVQINTVGRWLEEARCQLKPVSDNPALEAQMVIAHVLGKPRSWIFAHPEFIISDSVLEILTSTLKSVAEGYPFAYLTGEREFFGRPFDIQPGVLVPRPETELLVEEAIHWLKDHPERRQVADIGCGSGCIAVTLAAEIPDARVIAVDLDPLAVQITIKNAQKHEVNQRLHVAVGNLLESVDEPCDLICANLPYIPSKTLIGLPAARFEPILALDGGPDGLRLIETLLSQAEELLLSGGLLLLEIETSQSETAAYQAKKYFPKSTIGLKTDLAGHPRLVTIQN
jgi:release factor glutamine methyltransferase